MYKEMYLMLFNAVTDALRVLEVGNCDMAADILRAAQQMTEERYISALEH